MQYFAWMLLALIGAGGVAQAEPGNSIVLVLDNSASMIAGGSVVGSGQRLPPNDPERAAVLGTLIVDGMVRGSEDELVVVAFGDRKGEPARVARGQAEIRSLPYGGGTWFAPALTESAKLLRASTREGRIFVLFTDGSPTDIDRPKEALDILGDSPQQLWALGLYGGDDSRRMGGGFLERMVRTPEDLVLMDAHAADVVQQVVGAFTTSYARVLGSEPSTGTLAPGGSEVIEVGRYVTEVLVTAASVDPGRVFQASLQGPSGDVPARAQGDNGCPDRVAPGNAADACSPPRRHYAVFRAANDPYQASRWTLSLPDAPGPVSWGVILRYDIVAELSAPPAVRVGEPVPVEAQLRFRGQVFQDEAFFAADGFTATVNVGDDAVPLTHVGGGRFQGTWTPSAIGSVRATARFANRWLERLDSAEVEIEGFLDLTLSPTPTPVQLGRWTGARGETRRCAEIDLSTSLNADKVPVSCAPTGSSTQAVLTCGPVDGSEARVDGRVGQPLRWEVCVVARPCCGDLPEAQDTPFAVTFAGQHPHYAPGAVTVPVQFGVDRTGFLRCWWLEIAGVITAILLMILIYGWISPHDFDPALTVRVASNPAALRRASALVLCEQPGGRKGFYRNARLCITNDGNTLRTPAGALLVVEAGPGGSTRLRLAPGLEKQDRRTQRWVAVQGDDLAGGIEPGVTYRSGPLHLMFR